MTALAQEEYRRKMATAKAKQEEKIVDEHIKKYEEKLHDLEKQLRVIDAKKSRVQKALDANRRRHLLATRDAQQTSFRLDEIRDCVTALGTRLDKTRGKNVKELEKAQALKRSINEQLNAVEEHISAIRSMGGGWESNTKENLEKCALTKAVNISTFHRWHSVWPSLQVILAADAESPGAVNAMSSLQGFVHEWVVLRTLACDIKTISESQTKGGAKSADATAHSFKLALSGLKDRANTSSSQSLKDIMNLKREVAALEKQRRQLRGLFLDLNYALEEDCSVAVVAAKEAAASSNVQLQGGGREGVSVEVNLAEGASSSLGLGSTPDAPIVKMGTVVETRRGIGGDFISEAPSSGGTSRAPSGNPSPRPLDTAGKQKRVRAVSLTEKWLQSLYIPPSAVLSKAIARGLNVTDPTCFNATGHKHHHHHRRASKTETHVPFGQHDSADLKTPTLVEGEAWRQMGGEEMRAALVALETRCAWRHLQLSSAKYISKCLSSAASEWFYMSEKRVGQGDAMALNQGLLFNGITISLNGEDGYIRHTYPLTRPSKVIPAGQPVSGVLGGHATGKGAENCTPTTEVIDILRDGMAWYQRVVAFRRLVAQSAFASNTFAPAPPQLIVLQTMKVARGPVVRHQQSVYTMKKSEQQRIVLELAGQAPVPKPPQFTPKSLGRKRKVNSQIDRNLRKSERLQRVKTLVRRFQASAQVVADNQQQQDQSFPPAKKSEGSRMAVVEYERFHIPKFVPKLYSFEEVNGSSVVKPSQMLSKKSRSRVSSDGNDSEDSASSYSSEEEARHLLEEVAEAELQHITRSTVNAADDVARQQSGDRRDSEKSSDDLRDLYLPEKYSMMERLVSKEVSDQVITQLTLRMGGDAINVVVYWVAHQEYLRINAFCFAGSEEYTCVVDQSDMEKIFEGMPHLQGAQMQSPYLLHAVVERMKIEKMRRNDALAVMMRLRGEKGSKDGDLALPPGRPSALDSYSVDSIISGSSLLHEKVLNRFVSDDEEDHVRVVTIRAASSNALVSCCVARVKNNQWERMMKAIPHNMYRPNSVDEMLAKPKPKINVMRSTVY